MTSVPRGTVFLLGLSAVAGAIVLGLFATTTTTGVHSTSTVRGKTTTVDSSTTTKAPGGGRSDTALVALLTFGVGALVVASFWGRIQELTIGGVSIKLADAVVPTPGVALVDAAAAHVDSLTSTSADMIAAEVKKIADRRLGLVLVDLRQGDLWAPVNLRLFVLLLASRTRADVVVFTARGEGGSRDYVGAASVAQLADKLAADDPTVATAHRATETMPLDRPADGKTVGSTFFEQLHVLDDSRTQPTDARVDARTLETLAGHTLVAASVPSGEGRTLSRQKQRAALAFPLAYVPITTGGLLVEIVDRQRLATMVALAAVGLPATAD